MTGFVAATGMRITSVQVTGPALPGRGGFRVARSLTVPLITGQAVIGTLNIESPQPEAFDDQQFIEIYSRNIAAASVPSNCSRRRRSARPASVEAVNRELAIPLDDIITDATTVLDRYAGHDEDIIARLYRLYRGRGDPQPDPQGRLRRSPGKQSLAATALWDWISLDVGKVDPRRSAHPRPGSVETRGLGDPCWEPGYRIRRSCGHPPARPRRLRTSEAEGGPAERADHPDDRLRLGPVTRSSRPTRKTRPCSTTVPCRS